MKKIISILLVATLLLSFGACKAKKENKSADKLTVVSTIFPPYDYIRAITKDVDGINNIMLLAPGNESHSYEPSVSDIAQIKNADLFVYVGGESDEWVDNVLSTTGNANAVALTQIVQTYEESDEGILSEEAEAEESEEPEIDEHVWSSLKKSQEMISALCDKLCELDEADSAVFKKNAEAYSKQLADLDAQFTSFFASKQNKTIVIADRNPFRYFGEDYSLNIIAAFAGCSSNSEISLGVQNKLISAVKNNKLSTIYVLENNTAPYADAICKQTGAEKAVLNSCHNINQDLFDKGTTYYELMAENLQTFKDTMK